MPKILRGDIEGKLKLLIQMVTLIAVISGAYYGLAGRLDVLDERLKPIQASLKNQDGRITFLERLHFSTGK